MSNKSSYTNYTNYTNIFNTNSTTFSGIIKSLFYEWYLINVSQLKILNFAFSQYFQSKLFQSLDDIKSTFQTKISLEQHDQSLLSDENLINSFLNVRLMSVFLSLVHMVWSKFDHYHFSRSDWIIMIWSIFNPYLLIQIWSISFNTNLIHPMKTAFAQ